MKFLADISLFESIANHRCSVFNDAFSDVVERSDPELSHERRVAELAVENPVEETKEAEPIGNIMEKIESEPEPKTDEAESVVKEMGHSLHHAVGSMKKLDAFVKSLVDGMGDPAIAARGRAFADKYTKTLGLLYGYANRTWEGFKKLRTPKAPRAAKPQKQNTAKTEILEVQ